MKLTSSCLPYNNCKYQTIMLSNSNSNIASASSRKPPTCTRCRNHGFYNVQLKGHRNICQFKLCNCKHCILILQRRLVVIKSDREETEPRGKSIKKKRSSKKLEAMEEKNAGEALIEPMMGETLSSTFMQGKGHSESAVLNLAAFNAAEIPNVKNGSANLPKEQPRLLPADCAKLTTPHHPYYGFLHCSPRMRNFNPGVPPNVTLGSPRPGLPGMMVSLPDQPSMFLNFPVTYPQSFAINSPPLNLAIQRPMEPY